MQMEDKQDTSVEKSTEIHPTEMKPPTLFYPHDVVLEVEGMQLHVCKQVLAEKSPVFERMFKSEFKEKDLKEIPLPGKKSKDIVEFLRSFYDPETIRPITDDTVFTILPLAEEYQVSEVKGRCEHFIIQTLQKANNYETQRPDLCTLLKYISCAELYNMASVLPLAVTMCAKYTTTSLTDATIQISISKETSEKIRTERTKLTETLTKERIVNGDFDKVLEAFEFLSGSNDKDKGGAIRKFEDRLINACEVAAISRSNLVEFIIAGEKMKLSKLSSSAITLASKCKSKSLKDQKRYKEISKNTRSKINEKRVTFLEDNGDKCDVNLRMS